jgi:lupus La protein
MFHSKSPQVEFYFSDANLLTDEHLFKELQGDKNRPVPIKHVHTFTRMRRFQPYSAVVNALRESPVLEVVDTDRYSGEGNEGVRRKTPIKLITFEDDEGQHISLDEHFQRLKRRSLNNLDSSVYVKNFGNPDEAGQIELENFFRPYGAIMVRKRRDDSDNWKGSVFVEFENEDMQKQFLALDPKPQYKGNDLVIMGKREYSKMKCDEKGIVPNWERDPTGKNTRTFNRDHNDRDRRGGRGGGGRGRGGRGRGGRGRGNDRGDRDRKDWNGRRDDFQKSRDFKDSGNKRKADSDSAEREETKKAKVEIKEDA